jgi:Tfp pilus assembly protein PilO
MVMNNDNNVKTPARGSKLSVETTPLAGKGLLLSSPIITSNQGDGSKLASGTKRSSTPLHSDKIARQSLPTSPISRLNSSIVSPGSIDNRITLGGPDRKRLVDQFYDPFNNDAGAINHNPSSNELNKLLHSPTARGDDLNFNSEDKTRESFPDKITQTDFKSIISSGWLEFIPNSTQTNDDEDLTQYLLNIDRTFEEWQLDNDNMNMINQFENEKVDGRSLKPFRELLESIESIVTQHSRSSLQVNDINHQQQQYNSLAQLNKISDYLITLNDQLSVFLRDFESHKEIMKSEFQQQLNDNVLKLQDMKQQLSQLENRLNKLRNLINTNKTILSKVLPEKIRTLEIIKKQITEYSSTSNKKRYKTLNILLAVLIVLISIYYGYIETR